MSERTRPLLAHISILAAALLSGCGTTVAGNPLPSPVEGAEPSFPTSRPSPSRPGIPPPTSTSASTPPPGATALPPDDKGYVYIETKSGQTRCQISTDNVGCEAAFTNSPVQDGEHANGVHVSADGEIQWVLGNLGAMPTVTIDYRTYDAQGWTVAASTDGTRFTNKRTSHGMFVSIDNVESF